VPAVDVVDPRAEELEEVDGQPKLLDRLRIAGVHGWGDRVPQALDRRPQRVLAVVDHREPPSSNPIRAREITGTMPSTRVSRMS
jgi:hypothetical protein